MLTEDNIKKVTLRYLKGYYKYRPRASETSTTARLDMQTAGGIIADGHLSYEKEDGSTFLATFEATSKETKEEVVYRYRYGFLFWDTFMVAGLLTGFMVWWNYYADTFRVGEIGIPKMLIAIGLIWVGFQMAVAVLIRKGSKYRYIYAVQQFKEYHADDQWIAIGEDVFPHSEDFAFGELKHQCIYNGFGLIKVNSELEPHFILTPSRGDVFGKRRKVVNFFNQDEWGQRMSQNRYSGFFKKTFAKLPFKIPFKTPQLNIRQKFAGSTAGKYAESAKKYASEYRKRISRYRKTALPQIMVSITAIAFIGYIFFVELVEAKIIALDERKYLTEEDLAKLKIDGKPEPRSYDLDTFNVAPYEEQTESYLEGGDNDVAVRTDRPNEPDNTPDLKPENQRERPSEPEPNPPVEEASPFAFDTTSANAKTDSILGIKRPPKKEEKVEEKTEEVPSPQPVPELLSKLDSLRRVGVGMYSTEVEDNFVVYDCARMFSFTGTQYLIQESKHQELETAVGRIRILAKNGIQANYLWLGCFSDKDEGYVVFLEFLYTNKNEAKEVAIGYQKELKRKQVFVSNLRLRSLTNN